MDRNLWIAGVCSIVSNLISAKPICCSAENDSFDAYMRFKDQEVSFLFHIPTHEMKQYCATNKLNYATFHLPRYGYFVLDLGAEFIFKYVIAEFYLRLSCLSEAEILANPQLLKVERYAIGPH